MEEYIYDLYKEEKRNDIFYQKIHNEFNILCKSLNDINNFNIDDDIIMKYIKLVCPCSHDIVIIRNILIWIIFHRCI